MFRLKTILRTIFSMLMQVVKSILWAALIVLFLVCGSVVHLFTPQAWKNSYNHFLTNPKDLTFYENRVITLARHINNFINLYIGFTGLFICGNTNAMESTCDKLRNTFESEIKKNDI